MGFYAAYPFLIENDYPNQWLPANYGFHRGALVLNALIQVAFGIWVGASVWGCVFERQNIFRKTACSVGIGVVALALFQTSKNFYEATLIIPLVAIVGIMTINRKVLWVLGRVWLVLATLSISLITYRFWPHLRNEWGQPRTLSQQFYSVNTAYQKATSQRISSLAGQCGILNSSSLRHLVLDDLTYPYFMKAREPFHAVYVLGWWGRMSIEDPEQFLKAGNSSGIIAQCKWLPESLLVKAVRDQDLCCLPVF